MLQLTGVIALLSLVETERALNHGIDGRQKLIDEVHARHNNSRITAMTAFLERVHNSKQQTFRLAHLKFYSFIN